MVAEKKDESSRSILDRIEGDWDSPPPPRVAVAASPEVQAALDAAAARLVDSLDPPPVSVPTMDELDSGWGEEDDEEEEEEDEIEPELPDERLDPAAYAAAKAAREERIEARRQRRRAKADAKKARRKARLEAQRSKQKGKAKKARPAPKPARPSKDERSRARRAAAAAARAESGDNGDTDSDDDTDTDSDDDGALEPSSLPSRAKAKLPPSKPMSSGRKPMLSKTNQWMLAVAVVIFLAAAIFAAVVAR